MRTWMMAFLIVGTVAGTEARAQVGDDPVVEAVCRNAIRVRDAEFAEKWEKLLAQSHSSDEGLIASDLRKAAKLISPSTRRLLAQYAWDEEVAPSTTEARTRRRSILLRTLQSELDGLFGTTGYGLDAEKGTLELVADGRLNARYFTLDVSSGGSLRVCLRISEGGVDSSPCISIDFATGVVSGIPLVETARLHREESRIDYLTWQLHGPLPECERFIASRVPRLPDFAASGRQEARPHSPVTASDGSEKGEKAAASAL